MTPEQFRDLGARLYGKTGWRRQMAEDLGVTRQTIYRHADGVTPVSTRMQLALEALRDRRLHEIAGAADASPLDPTSAGGGPVAVSPAATGRVGS